MRRSGWQCRNLRALVHVSLLALAWLPAAVAAENGETDRAGVGSETGPIADGSGAAPLRPGKSDSFYCAERKLGTWFYCDRTRPAAGRPVLTPPEPAPAARLAAIGKRLEELKARAILDPSEANVAAFIRYQREQLDRASTFSDQWQRTIWQNPGLDYTLQRPVSTLGKRAWIDNRRREVDRTMATLSRRYGIFYFYAQACAACEVFGPILKSLAERHRFNVVAVSMDGGPNRTFPDHVVDAGQHERMGLSSRATPALVLFDTIAKRPMVIGTGILSADEIQERIFALTNTNVGSDF